MELEALDGLRLGAALLLAALPGLGVSLLLRSEDLVVSSFVVAPVVLFETLLGLDLAGVRLGFPAVAATLMLWSLVTLGLAWRLGRVARGGGARAPVRPRVGELLLVSGLAALLALAALRTLVLPLSGPDTAFRWDFLARQVLDRRELGFYPPVAPGDYQGYFYCDAIPPIVSLSYFWLYTGYGSAEPLVAGLFALAQLAVLAWLVARSARREGRPGAGLLGAAVLLSSPLLFWSVFIGQETGLTAISLVATLYFLTGARSAWDPGAMLLAGAATALGALSREYGWAFLPCGVIACVWRRLTWRATALFAGSALLLGLPWYLRTWIRTGNPVYPLDVAGLFPVNSLLVSYVDHAARAEGCFESPSECAVFVLGRLAWLAPLPFVAGIPGVLRGVRRNGYRALAVGVALVLWIQSIPLTYSVSLSLRVLSPALALLSVAGGILLADLQARSRTARRAVLALVGASVAIAAPGYLTAPRPVAEVPGRGWLAAALDWRKDRARYEQVAELLVRVLPPGARVLSEDAYAASAALPRGVPMVPVWSAEVADLFDPALSAGEAWERLRARGIDHVLWMPGTRMSQFLLRFPVFARLAGTSTPVAELEVWRLYRLPPPGDP